MHRMKAHSDKCSPSRSWRLTLVMCAGLPAMGAVGWLVAAVMSWNETQGAVAHRAAASIAQESLANMRTGERRT